MATTCLGAAALGVYVCCLFDLIGLRFGQILPLENMPHCFSSCVAACTLDGVCALVLLAGKYGAVSSANATGCG